MFGGSIDKAIMLDQHRLTNEAKKELIEVIFSQASAEDKAHSYYLLGSIAFRSNEVSVALETWKKLSEKYPRSSFAIMVEDRINELSQIVGESTRETIDNAIAQSYLRNGDFWSEGKATKFNIDSSWIPNVEAALKWYDRVITEFPSTPAAKIAYEEKLRTILGWSPSKYMQYGLQESFTKYIPLLTNTFDAFERAFPTASSLQAFRYQIAQAYWKEKKWNETRIWLNKIINEAGSEDSFYKDLAQRRLLKVEY